MRNDASLSEVQGLELAYLGRSILEMDGTLAPCYLEWGKDASDSQGMLLRNPFIGNTARGRSTNAVGLLTLSTRITL